MVFGSEYGRYFKHSFIHGHKSLLIKLGALRKINRFAEVIELENVRAALCSRKIDFRGMYFGKVLALQIFAETALYSFLNFENSPLLGVSQRYGAVVKID